MINRRRYIWTVWCLGCWLCLVQPLLYAQDQNPPRPLVGKSLEPITFQLRWHHQFQFAGYYAAKEKGFYEEAGFDVTLVAGLPVKQPVTEVLAGRAQYGVSNSEVLYERLRGEPLVALAAVFQHSPSVLVTLKSSGIRNPRDLVGKRVMTVGGQADAGILAMLRAEQIPVSDVELIDSSYQIQDLLTGKTDAFNSYLTNEPFYLEQQGVAFNIINPSDYGIDFYSDILFTTVEEAENHPERAERFKQATIRGWEYALANPEEIIQIIREKYNDKKSLNHMRFEALSVQGLIMHQLVEIGYINPQRIEMMASVFLQQGMVDSLDRLEDFIFSPEGAFSDELFSLLVTVVIFLVVMAVVAMVLGLFNHRLQKEIQDRKAAEEKLKLLADTDPLTLLLNRRAFSKRCGEERVRAERYGSSFSILLIDLDRFKQVNDRYGHEAGDKVLMAVADMLSKKSRETDRCGRFGGEEFILMLPNTPEGEAEAYANRLCLQLNSKEILLGRGRSLTVSASIGVAEWQAGENYEDTIRRADKALYRAKDNGRNQVASWSEGV